MAEMDQLGLKVIGRPTLKRGVIQQSQSVVFFTPKTQAIVVMQQSTARDMTYAMFQQLVAAELNIDCLDSNQSCVTDAIQAAETFMAAHHVGTLSADSADWRAVKWAYDTLYNYNEGNLCAPHIE